eukprot:CAMPEP_0172607878 /NCGR_PEP_ID=MMETSP1068-20121228/28017_1 /TAXON_ID=35684 /ORGANISM="Pseudopedinella elastica, Strain CCMP716" /LENGTH=139 /DNA_ID=CAMNT_0013411003 /DNA_START=493 /DNA_END=912 /DNA_ORIENTATION=+
MAMKTCPGALGFVGEHSSPSEDWMDTAKRGLSEELGLLGNELSITDMTPGSSVLVQTSYPEFRRRELQATKIFLVHLEADQARRIKGDDEIAEMFWSPLRDALALIENSKPNDRFCNEELSDLAELVLELAESGAPEVP